MLELGTNGQGEPKKEPESLIQMLGAKCEDRIAHRQHGTIGG